MLTLCKALLEATHFLLGTQVTPTLPYPGLSLVSSQICTVGKMVQVLASGPLRIPSAINPFLMFNFCLSFKAQSKYHLLQEIFQDLLLGIYNVFPLLLRTF